MQCGVAGSQALSVRAVLAHRFRAGGRLGASAGGAASGPKAQGRPLAAQALDVVSFALPQKRPGGGTDPAVRGPRTRLPCGARSAGALMTYLDGAKALEVYHILHPDAKFRD